MELLPGSLDVSPALRRSGERRLHPLPHAAASPTLQRYGLSLRLYRPESDDWSIYWVSSLDGLLQAPVTGGFVDGVGTFLGDDTYDGRPIRVRYLWSEIEDASARWEQAFSVDGEQTWETNWVMSLRREARAGAPS